MTRPFDMGGKVALITGASRGLGYEMAKAFAQHGADIDIVRRKLDACEAIAQEIESAGRRALPHAPAPCVRRPTSGRLRPARAD